jgi:cobaltochelatase CobN
MHLLPVTAVSLDESERAVDLGQTPGDIVALSFADSDLGALAAAYDRDCDRLPTLRLASLKQLRHPLSVDLYAESIVAQARFVLVRCLGGVDYWRYGLERLSAVCRSVGIKLAVLPGDDRPDPRLAGFATVSPALADELGAYFRAGGVANLRQLLRRMAAEIGRDVRAEPPKPIPLAFVLSPRGAEETVEQALARLPADQPYALLILYRSAALSGDTAAMEALAAEIEKHGAATLMLAVSSLKDPEAVEVVDRLIAARRPDVIVTATAFSARNDASFVLDRADCPILQAITAGTTREAWQASARGLGVADLAMQIALPEFDGRLAARPMAFKAESKPDPALGFSRRVQAPDLGGVADLASQALAWIRLARTPRAERRLALILSDYPARGGRAGFAVGLDTPASACGILDCLADEGYDARRRFSPDALMPSLTEGAATFAVPLADYEDWLASIPEARRTDLAELWGAPTDDPAVAEGAFRFRTVRAGKVLVALQPDRGRALDRKAGYHDPGQPPCHAYLAFYLGLREQERIDALIHLGTHGTTEWLPGKAVALSGGCWPHLVRGPMPVIYPFIVDDPGEAAPAKRRLGAVTIGHLPPPIAEAGLSGEAAVLRERVEEFSAAQVLDPRRADCIAREILERAEANGLASACNVGPGTPIEEALTALDAHLCDLAEVAIRDGLHVFGQAPPGLDACAQAERENLLRALDGRFVPPGPSGSPWRGRSDVLPTGRNLTTLDPRAIPTRSATAFGEKAAAEVVRRHLQDHGDYPRRIVMDLWASPTLRTGGEDIAHALALMGVRPKWDNASTRVSGFEIVPLPLLDRPRIDVTVRVSGAFRDTFPTQIALLDRAARAVARLEEDDEWNELAAARRRGSEPARVFGAAPGRYGAGVASEALDEAWVAREDLGRAYLDSTSHAFGLAEDGVADLSFAHRVGDADAFVHVSDVRERDILDGDAAADAIGGFGAAAEMLGRAPALYSLDASRADGPKARTLYEDVSRLVRGRLAHPRWIDAQLRHGWRGAAELAQAVDALFVFAATTDAVTDAAFEAVYAAYVADPAVHERIRVANPAAARAIADRLTEARHRGLWTSRRNSVGVLREAAE